MSSKKDYDLYMNALRNQEVLKEGDFAGFRVVEAELIDDCGRRYCQFHLVRDKPWVLKSQNEKIVMVGLP